MAVKFNAKTRRKALKAVAVGAPIVWCKPVVEGIVLPAHASTTTSDCEQCGQQLLVNDIGSVPPQRWSSTSVLFNTVNLTFQFRETFSNMNQYVVVDESCVGNLVRLSFGDGGGVGPLRVAVIAGNGSGEITYTGGGLTALDVQIEDFSNPVAVFISAIPPGTGGGSYDTSTTIIEPALTVVCPE